MIHSWCSYFLRCTGCFLCHCTGWVFGLWFLWCTKWAGGSPGLQLNSRGFSESAITWSNGTEAASYEVTSLYMHAGKQTGLPLLTSRLYWRNRTKLFSLIVAGVGWLFMCHLQERINICISIDFATVDMHNGPTFYHNAAFWQCFHLKFRILEFNCFNSIVDT